MDRAYLLFTFVFTFYICYLLQDKEELGVTVSVNCVSYPFLIIFMFSKQIKTDAKIYDIHISYWHSVA